MAARCPAPHCGWRKGRSLRNELPQASSRHWHGIRIDNAMNGVAGLTQPAAEPLALAPNPRMEVTGLDTRARLNMQGDAMGTLDAAFLNGERISFRELVEANQFWAFNGMIGMTDRPLMKVSTGETVMLEIYNETNFPHAMHLHGMHFREMRKDGGLGPFRDTLLMVGDETRTIGFVADNPGDWLVHCHMLSHAASGMMTWMKVT